MLRAIKTFIKDPEPTSKFEKVVTGLNLVDGIVRIHEPLRSPVRGQNCVAFFYRSFLVIEGGRAPAFHKIKEAEVYAPLEAPLHMVAGNHDWAVANRLSVDYFNAYARDAIYWTQEKLSPEHLRFLSELVRASLPKVAVLSFNEVVPARAIETVSVVRMPAEVPVG